MNSLISFSESFFCIPSGSKQLHALLAKTRRETNSLEILNPCLVRNTPFPRKWAQKNDVREGVIFDCHSLPKFCQKRLKELVGRFFYVVDEAAIRCRGDGVVGKGARFLVDQAGHEAFRFRKKREGRRFGGWVVARAHIFDFLQMFLVPLRRVEFIEGNAGGEDIDVGETAVVDGFFDEVHELLRIESRGLRDEAATGGDGHGDGVEGRRRVSVGGRLCHEALAGGRAGLAFREAVDLVIKDEIRDVHIPFHRVHRVPEANRVGIAVAGADDGVEVFIGAFDALREGERAPVRGVRAVAIVIAADAGRAADTGNEGDIFKSPAFLGADGRNRILNPEVAAAGAPIRNDFVFIFSR